MRPSGSRALQRVRLATQSLARTGSPLWNFSPDRSLKVQVRPSLEVSSLSTICRCGSSFSSKPYSVSHTSTEALRTTYCVPQIGSKFARFACGTKRSVFAAAPCEMAGVDSPPVATMAPAPAVVFKNVLRSMTKLSCSPHPDGRPKPCQSATSFGDLPMPQEAEVRPGCTLGRGRSKAHAMPPRGPGTRQAQWTSPFGNE